MSLRARLAREEGISLAVTICSIGLMVTLSTIAMTEAVSALRHSGHQAQVKRSLQAADAAIDAAVFRIERADLGNAINIDPLQPGTVTSQNCVVSTGTVVDLLPLDLSVVADPDGRKWCPTTATESTSENSEFSYRMSQVLRVGTGTCGHNDSLSLDREIVAVGRSGGTVRRVKARLRAAVSLLSSAAVQSSSPTQALTMLNTARVLGNVHSNAAITGFATNVIAGNAIPGPGFAVSGVTPTGTTTAACQPLVLPAVDQGTAPSTNDNASTTNGCVDILTGLGVACKPLLVTTGSADYEPGTRTLRVWGNGRAVLTGSTYSFCSIRLENTGVLQIQSTSPVTRIFLDDPDNCRVGGALIANAGQITVDGQARIINCHLQTQPESLQLYAVGNASIPTTQTLQGGSLITGVVRAALCGANVPLVGEPMVVYAPRSTIELGGSMALAGQVAGNVVHMSGIAAVQPVTALINLGSLGANPVLPLYKPTDYVECTGLDFDELPPTDPAQGC